MYALRAMRGTSAAHSQKDGASSQFLAAMIILQSCCRYLSCACGARYQRNSMNHVARQGRGVRPPVSTRRPAHSAGTARQQYERYMARAVDAQRSGDVIETENCYQHAEHYFRVIRERNDAPQCCRRETVLTRQGMGYEL